MSNAKSPKTLDVNDQEQLLTHLLRKGSPPKTVCKGIRNYLIACLMLDAGLRVGEVIKLKFSHLYFNLAPVKTLVLTPSMTKNHKERTVPVSARLKEALFEFHNATNWVKLAEPSHYVFISSVPTVPMTTRQVENIITEAGMKSVGRPVNPHMLRHTFASRLLRITNMRTVQELLGHNYITSTQIYTHPNEDDKKEAIEKLEDASHEYMSDRFGPSGG